MANAETCPMCGQRIATYKHKLNKVLISALFKLRDHGGKGKIDNLGLTHSEFANMQKLRYFGLVDKEGCIYILNELGRKFLENKAKVPAEVYTKHGQLIGTSNMVYANQVDAYVQIKEEWKAQAATA